MKGRIETEIKVQRATRELLKTMPEFIEEWYLDMQRKKKAPASCYEYTRTAKRFLEYIDTEIKNVDINKITLQSCESFIISCETKKDKKGMETYTSYQYRQTTWSALSNLMGFLAKNNYIEYNFMEDIERPVNPNLNDTIKRIKLTQRDFNKILNAAKDGSGYKKGLLGNRDVLIILLFMTTGMKKTELAEINIEDIDINKKILTIKGRNNKTSVYNLNEQVMTYLDKWLKDRESLKTDKSGYALFLKKDGTRLGDDSVYDIVQKNCYKGIGKKLSPQQLRTGFCSILYKKTHDINFVSKAVGHSNIQMTQRCIQTKNNEREKATNIMSDILNI